MSDPLSRLRVVLAVLLARSTASCRRSLIRWSLLRLRLLQRRERRLTRRLEVNRQRQLHRLQSPLLMEHRRQQLMLLQKEEPQPQFDLHHLL